MYTAADKNVWQLFFNFVAIKYVLLSEGFCGSIGFEKSQCFCSLLIFSHPKLTVAKSTSLKYVYVLGTIIWITYSLTESLNRFSDFYVPFFYTRNENYFK
jgi:hypothetical protein